MSVSQTFNETATALADNVRTMTGTEEKLGLLDMAEMLDAANQEVTTQNVLIDRIRKALEGKAAGGGGGDTSIPAGYTRCDFILFTGGQFVDIGLIGNQDTKIQTSFTWESTTQRHLFGCVSADNTASITSYMNGSWRFGDKSATKQVAVKTVPYGVLVDKTHITLSASNTNLSGVSDFETVGTLLVGGARSGDGALPSAGFIGKMLYFLMWQSDVLVRKLVPVVSSEGVYRFYDQVSMEFFDSVSGTALQGGNW
jgi:hypothetical protein